MFKLQKLLLGISFVAINSSYVDAEDKTVKIDRIGTTVSKVPAVSETTIRSSAELKKMAIDPLLATSLNLAGVDYEKQMVVVVRSGMTNAFGVELSLLSAGVADGTLTVKWQYKPYFGGAAPPNQPGNPTLVAVLDRYDGGVKFVRTNWKLPEGVPPPPSAPPGGGRPRSPSP